MLIRNDKKRDNAMFLTLEKLQKRVPEIIAAELGSVYLIFRDHSAVAAPHKPSAIAARLPGGRISGRPSSRARPAADLHWTTLNAIQVITD